MIYLDSAATTLQKPPQVARASAWAMGHLASPGRGGHSAAMAAADTAFACRQEAARLFHLSDPERVVFTFNATHGLNIAIKSLVRPGSTVVISGYEHNAVTRPLHAIPNVTVRVAESPLLTGRERWRPSGEPSRRRYLPWCAATSPMCSGLSCLWRRLPGCAGSGTSRLSWTRPSRQGAFLWIWKRWARPIWPCRGTRGSMAPRVPACSCAATRRPNLC